MGEITVAYDLMRATFDVPAEDLRTGDMVWHALGSCRTVQDATLSDDGALVDVRYADGTRQLTPPWLLMSVSRTGETTGG